jgi:hypothetical protein
VDVELCATAWVDSDRAVLADPLADALEVPLRRPTRLSLRSAGSFVTDVSPASQLAPLLVICFLKPSISAVAARTGRLVTARKRTHDRSAKRLRPHFRFVFCIVIFLFVVDNDYAVFFPWNCEFTNSCRQAVAL